MAQFSLRRLHARAEYDTDFRQIDTDFRASQPRLRPCFRCSMMANAHRTDTVCLGYTTFSIEFVGIALDGWIFHWQNASDVATTGRLESMDRAARLTDLISEVQRISERHHPDIDGERVIAGE
jgi:hypothetical protein